MLHKEILSETQRELLSFIVQFHPRFGLCGGTAISLHIGHRESIDFDLFSNKEVSVETIRKKLVQVDPYFSVLVKNEDEYTVVGKGVKMTFLHYPFPLEFRENDKQLWLPDLLTLGAMKAYALGRRSKWKDYVDLYFILSQHHSLDEISKKARAIFGNEFNEKVFRSALSYFDDIDFTEQVIFRPGYEVSVETIKKALTTLSTE